MKKIYAILTTVLISTVLFAQSPQKMSYQAVIRNSSDQLVSNHAVGMKISILRDATPVYVETQTPTTNINGLATIEIGGGTPVTGTFAGIDWSNGTYFIKTETDPAGGTSYSITGTSQILSVPYALYAKASDYNNLLNKPVFAAVATSGSYNDLSNKPTTNGSETKVTAGSNVTVTGTGTTASPYVINATGGGSFSHYLGESKDGGIIFNIFKGSDGQEHGLILALTEGYEKWQNVSVSVGANRTWDGVYNTDLMTDSPAKTYVTSLGAGWYLPSIDELSILWHNRFYVNEALSDGGNTLLSPYSLYWSSTEYNADNAWSFGVNGYEDASANGGYPKSWSNSVRAIRRF